MTFTKRLKRRKTKTENQGQTNLDTQLPRVPGQANAGENGAGQLFDWLREGRIG